MFKKLVLAGAVSMAMGAAHALTLEEARAKLPGSDIKEVNQVQAIPGLYELLIGKNTILYTDEAASKLVIGQIMDIRTQTNETQERINSLSTIEYGELDKANAIKIVKGDGAREFAVFSDPDCPFCKRLDKELVHLDNYTMYLYPLSLLGGQMTGTPQNPSTVTSIWCSENREEAWKAYTLTGVKPAPKWCDTPIMANAQKMSEFGLGGTPSLIGINGKHNAGFMEAYALEAWLNVNGRKQ